MMVTLLLAKLDDKTARQLGLILSILIALVTAKVATLAIDGLLTGAKEV